MLAQGYVHWYGITEDIEKHVGACESCLLNSNDPAKAPPHPWEKSTRPWQRVHIDHAGPMKNKWFLVVYDSYSKWIDVQVVSSTGSQSTIEKLRSLFATHGLPETLVSDNATGFASREFETFLSQNGVMHITSAPYHPASNGPAERSVQTFKAALAKLEGDEKKGSLETQVSRLLFSYRCTPHTATGVSPAELLMRRRLRSRLSAVKEHREENPAGTVHKTREMEIGDSVITRSYTAEKWMKGVIMGRSGAVMYEVEMPDGRVARRHVDQIRAAPNMEWGMQGRGELSVGLNASVTIANETPAEDELVGATESLVGAGAEPIQEPVAPSPMASSTPKKCTPQKSPQMLSGVGLRRSNRVTRAPVRMGDYV